MNWSKISLVFLFIVALIGTLLRSTFFLTLPLQYSNLVHAHSHVAFQGWIYTLMILFLTHLFLKKEQIYSSRYLLQFKLTCLVIFAILISFSLQGYGLYSIIFSTLFQLLNYWFIYSFLRDLERNYSSNNSLTIRFIKAGLWLGVLSTLVPIGIGILSAKGMAGTEIYESFVYGFLHLQYNGWFLFVGLGLFYRYLELNAIPYDRIKAGRFYKLFVVTVVPAIILSLLGMSYIDNLLVIAYLIAALQGLGLVLFYLAHQQTIKVFMTKKWQWSQIFFIAFLTFFILKEVLQLSSVLPFFKSLAFQNKLIVLAYLHLSLIGVVSFLFFAWMIELKWLKITRGSRIGILSFLVGFILTEMVLVTGGMELFYSPQIVFGGSALMAIGVLIMILSRMHKQASYGKI